MTTKLAKKSHMDDHECIPHHRFGAQGVSPLIAGLTPPARSFDHPLVLQSLVLYCLCLVFPCLVLSWLSFLSHLGLRNPVLSCLVFSCLVLSCLVFPWLLTPNLNPPNHENHMLPLGKTRFWENAAFQTKHIFFIEFGVDLAPCCSPNPPKSFQKSISRGIKKQQKIFIFFAHFVFDFGCFLETEKTPRLPQDGSKSPPQISKPPRHFSILACPPKDARRPPKVDF